MDILLPSTYFPTHEENRMENEGNLETARRIFFDHRPTNLEYLLKKRFEWMNDYLNGKENIVEIGAGAGFSKEFIQNKNFKLSDFKKYPWIDEEVDALNPPWAENSIDAIVSSHMIHHLASPVKFFEVIKKVLRPGGLLVIQEINTSFLMKLLLRMMRHEGWSYDVDIFDRSIIANDPSDPWSANCAIPQMLWKDASKFEEKVPGFKVIKNEVCECFIFPLSGGVIAKTKLKVNLPFPLLRVIDAFDGILVKLFPSVFALGRRVVLQKTF